MSACGLAFFCQPFAFFFFFLLYAANVLSGGWVGGSCAKLFASNDHRFSSMIFLLKCVASFSCFKPIAINFAQVIMYLLLDYFARILYCTSDPAVGPAIHTEGSGVYLNAIYSVTRLCLPRSSAHSPQLFLLLFALRRCHIMWSLLYHACGACCLCL